MPQEKTKDLAKHILEIVDDHSGGIKLIELIAQLSRKDSCNLFEEMSPKQLQAQLYELIIEAIESLPELGIFTYCMMMSNDLLREEMFVHRTNVCSVPIRRRHVDAGPT